MILLKEDIFADFELQEARLAAEEASTAIAAIEADHLGTTHTAKETTPLASETSQADHDVAAGHTPPPVGNSHSSLQATDEGDSVWADESSLDVDGYEELISLLKQSKNSLATERRRLSRSQETSNRMAMLSRAASARIESRLAPLVLAQPQPEDRRTDSQSECSNQETSNSEWDSLTAHIDAFEAFAAQKREAMAVRHGETVITREQNIALQVTLTRIPILSPYFCPRLSRT